MTYWGAVIEQFAANDAHTFAADWDGSNYASGVYYYSLTTESFKEIKKMILVK